MDIIKTFGNYVEKWCENTPDRARWLLTKGWEAQDMKFRLAPSKKINRLGGRKPEIYRGTIEANESIRSISCKVNDECHAAAIKTSGKFCFGKCIHSM